VHGNGYHPTSFVRKAGAVKARNAGEDRG
jgi:hypothetical protein